jgi:YfiH family protein
VSIVRYEFDHRKNAQAVTLPKWKQVHGVSIVEVTSGDQDCGEVDGLWTRVPKLPIAVVTADCVPILLMNQSRGIVAALHAGWRGTQQKIVEAFFKSIPSEWSDGSEWKAILGPSIRACCYEVSEELVQQFKNEFPEMSSTQIEPKPRRLDLIEVNVYQLLCAGVNEVVIHPDCTFCKKDEAGNFKYYSYRRGDRCSRQYSVIEIK